MSNNNFSIDGFEQFISSEIPDTKTFNMIYNFVALDNFRYGEYEGNEYVIRKINLNHIQLSQFRNYLKPQSRYNI